MLKGEEKEKGLSAFLQDKLLRKVGVSEKFFKSLLQHFFSPETALFKHCRHWFKCVLLKVRVAQIVRSGDLCAEEVKTERGNRGWGFHPQGLKMVFLHCVRLHKY